MPRSIFVTQLPNLVTGLRLVLLPVLLVLAARDHPHAFLLTVAFCFLSDVVDGFLARTLGLSSEFGARLDSVTDFLFYLTVALGTMWLWPDIMRREAPFFAAVISSVVLPPLLALVKFKSTTSYHTWATKLAALAVGLSLLALLAFGLSWPFRAAALLAVVAALEEMAITLIVPIPRPNVRSIWHVLNR
jgi:CDP-diacylglycerol--glycerol-3-phosphate 3-phosphatidyltransferase